MTLLVLSCHSESLAIDVQANPIKQTILAYRVVTSDISMAIGRGAKLSHLQVSLGMTLTRIGQDIFPETDYSNF